MESALPDLVGVVDAAKILGKSRWSVLRLVKSGDLKPALTLPGTTGSHLFLRADVERLVDAA